MLHIVDIRAVHMDVVSFLRVKDKKVVGLLNWGCGIILAQSYLILCVRKFSVDLRGVSRGCVQTVVLYWVGDGAFGGFCCFLTQRWNWSKSLCTSLYRWLLHVLACAG